MLPQGLNLHLVISLFYYTKKEEKKENRTFQTSHMHTNKYFHSSTFTSAFGRFSFLLLFIQPECEEEVGIDTHKLFFFKETKEKGERN